VTSTAGNLLEISGLTKKYSRKQVLSNINLSIPSGRIVGLFGPKGSGKTTLIKIIAGLTGHYKGQVLIDGHKPGDDTKSIVSYFTDETYFSEWMKISDFIDLFNDFYADFDKAKAIYILEQLGITPQLTFDLLNGTAHKVIQLVLVMSRAAKLYVLDEPFADVNSEVLGVVLDIIQKNHNGNSTILIATQLVPGVEKIFDRVIFLMNGQIILNEDVDTLRKKYRQSVGELFSEVYK